MQLPATTAVAIAVVPTTTNGDAPVVRGNEITVPVVVKVMLLGVGGATNTSYSIEALPTNPGVAAGNRMTTVSDVSVMAPCAHGVYEKKSPPASTSGLGARAFPS